MGLVTGYGSVAAGIEQPAWLALEDLEASGLADRIDYIETVDTRDRAANIAYFVEAGYDIVVTTGAGITVETIAAARQNPDVFFVNVQPAHEPVETPINLVRLEFKEERAGFLAGAAAAMITRTQQVAAVCEAEFIDYVERYCEGFGAGARYVDERIQTNIVYRTGAEELLFRDTEWGQAIAAQVIDEGADVVFAVGEATAKAAMVEAARLGARVIASQTDVYEEMPEIKGLLVTSATLQVREGLRSLISDHLSRQLPAQPYLGSVGLAPFREYGAQLPTGVATELVVFQDEVNSGALDAKLPFDGP